MFSGWQQHSVLWNHRWGTVCSLPQHLFHQGTPEGHGIYAQKRLGCQQMWNSKVPTITVKSLVRLTSANLWVLELIHSLMFTIFVNYQILLKDKAVCFLFYYNFHYDSHTETKIKPQWIDSTHLNICQSETWLSLFVCAVVTKVNENC